MANTFHRFNDLPWELRNLIWNHASRSPSPGVHIFKLYYPRLEISNHTVASIDTSLSLADKFHLVIPSRSTFFTSVTEASGCSNDSATWWKHGNPSTYLIDSGMWTACKESRLVIGRNFNWNHWSKVRRERYRSFHLMPENEQDRVPVAIRFDNNEVKDQWFTVLPQQDLFVLQPQCTEAGSGSYFAYEIPSRFPEFTLLGIHHMGIEYNTIWGVEIQDAGSNYAKHPAIRAIIEAIYLYDNVWIVDYNLTRRPKAFLQQGPKDPEKTTFYASDRRFVEVKCDYEGSSLNHWHYIQDKGDDSTCCTSIDFIMKARAAWGDQDVWKDPEVDPVNLLGWEILERSS